MQKTFSLNVISDRELHDVSNMLFGIFLEDINFACDGGLNANMVNNSSFDGIYLSRKGCCSCRGDPTGLPTLGCNQWPNPRLCHGPQPKETLGQIQAFHVLGNNRLGRSS